MQRSRHATAEAGWRTSAAWAEFTARHPELRVVQGDALAAGGPRLDYEFTQFGA